VIRCPRMVRKYCIAMSGFDYFRSLVIDLSKFSTVGNNQPEIIKDFT